MSRKLLITTLLVFAPLAAQAQTGSVFDIPLLKLEGQGGGQTLSLTLQTLALMTALTLLPSLLLVTTSFTRIIVTLSILRQALGTQQTPPNQVLVGLALFMTLFVMAPTFKQINETAFAPYVAGQIAAEEAGVRGLGVMKSFMVRHTRESDLLMLAEMQGDKSYENPEAVPVAVLVPAFILSELRTAFTIGFLLFLPFLVIDNVVASLLISLGMLMLSPPVISVPGQLVLVVRVDGWSMTMSSLVESFTKG
jgi:flagellar biosynthetic protein FliP